VNKRQVYVISISTPEWTLVLDWLRCPGDMVWTVRSWLEDPRIIKVGHNLSFDQIAMWQWRPGCTVRSHHDTMITHQVLNNGLLLKAPSLAELMQDYLGHYLDKTLQTSFDGSRLTEQQVWYAASDVSRILELRDMQMAMADEKGLREVIRLENRCVPAFARMEYDGIGMDAGRWGEAGIWAAEQFYKIRAELQSAFESDPILLTEAITNKDIVVEDTLTVNWNSPPQCKEIALQFLGPLTGLSKPILKRAVEICIQEKEAGWADIFGRCLDGDWSGLEEYLLSLGPEEHQWLSDGGGRRVTG
jgi:hypothetical protein